MNTGIEQADAVAPNATVDEHQPTSVGESVFVGGGEMGELMRSFDWSTTPLGPVETWRQSLRMMVRFLLANRFPMLLWWGPDYACLYNDGYRPILGRKHPRSLGQPVREVWNEIWHILQPLIDTPFNGGPSTWMDDITLEINRHGFVEESHFTIAYSPVPDESAPRGIGGVLATVHEITEQVIGERRTSTLRNLGARSAEAKTADEACAVAAQILSGHTLDVPFAMLYLIESDGTRARLAGASGVEIGAPISPHIIDLGDVASPGPGASLRDAFNTAMVAESLYTLDDLASRFASVPAGPWSDAPSAAAVLPIPSNKPHRFAGFLVVGLSARLAFDERYRTFLELLTAQVATAIANARAYEEERQRAEALAELDRVKTAFFANISHEFRTPLTLLLGPIEETLRRETGVEAVVREDLTTAHRNALRLLRLVNSLLDFSRIEAGRVDAVFEPTSLGSFTAELVSSFRSATTRAGLTLEIQTDELPEQVWVDHAMWEKIVLNLISNAFKHTFEGGITTTLRADGPMAVVDVRDTGVGIPPDQLPYLFERFHRVPNARSRTYEGTGIGLALVRELVKLHGGEIGVVSHEGVGTTFTVRVPLGTEHLPQDQLVASGTTPRRESTGVGAAAYVEEALRWLPDTTSEFAVTEPLTASGSAAFLAGTHDGRLDVSDARVLLVDDNADLRDYVARLLRSQGWTVDAVSDGLAALESVRASLPDLVLTDVMMPGIDGFALLRELRSDPRMANVPVVVLSARAGEESRVEGAGLGADDYLVKPFSAQELIARVGVHLRLGRQRRDAELALVAAQRQAEVAREQAEAANRTKSEFLAVMSHELRTPLNAIAGYVELIDMGVHGPVTVRQREALARIHRSEKHLLALINDVLNFAKLEAGRVEYKPGDVRLADAVAAVSPMIEGQHRAKGLSYEVRVDPNAVVRADSDKLQQVLLNLLSNAVKFTDRGGRITVDTPIEVATGGSASITLRVSDTGIGIPADKQVLIFDPFVQVHRRLTSSTEGSGLGLAISRDLARGMDGDLEVASVEGAGSTFSLTLPRSPT